MVGALLSIVVPARGDEPARTEVVWFEFDESVRTGDIIRALEVQKDCYGSTRLK